MCNGCGLCCLAEPCPLGMVLSLKRKGACVAVRWSEADLLYRCGVVVEPQKVVRQVLPAIMLWLGPAVGWLLGKLAHRWIAAGIGCDATLEAEPPTLQTDDGSGVPQPSQPISD